MLVVWGTVGRAALRNIQRSTQYIVRQRRRGRRVLTRVTNAFPRLRGKRRPARRDPGIQFVSLAAPGIVVAAIGLYGLLRPSGPIAVFDFVVLTILSFVFALRAYTARASPRMRGVTVALNLLYPVLSLLVRLFG